MIKLGGFQAESTYLTLRILDQDLDPDQVTSELNLTSSECVIAKANKAVARACS